jgi:SNF2 family DNA or RNA helicase
MSTLRPSQEKCIKKMMEKKYGGILYGETGTGKTTISFALVQRYREEEKNGAKPSIVVCSKTVSTRWVDEAKNFPSIFYVLIDSSKKAKMIFSRKIVDKNKDDEKDESDDGDDDSPLLKDKKILERKTPDLYICTYENVINIPKDPQLSFHYLFVDECHNLSNPKTLLYKNMMDFITIFPKKSSSGKKSTIRTPSTPPSGRGRTPGYSRVDFVWGLSGTVLQNNIEELSHQVNLIYPGSISTTFESLIDTFVVTLLRDYETEEEHHERILDLSEEEKRLYDYIRTRETGSKKEALQQITTLREACISAEMLPLIVEEHDRREIDRREENDDEKDNKEDDEKDNKGDDEIDNSDGEKHKEKMFKNMKSTKLDTIIKDIKSIDKNDKIVVFSSFRTAIDILGRKIEEEIFKNTITKSIKKNSIKKSKGKKEPTNEMNTNKKKGIEKGEEKESKEEQRKCFYISGMMSIQKRTDTIREFEESKNGSILLITLKTGSEGIELTCANHVIFIEDWWNPATIVQSISRSKRFGQTKKVHWYTYIMKGTVEEKINMVAQRKQKMIEKVLKRKSSPDNDHIKDVENDKEKDNKGKNNEHLIEDSKEEKKKSVDKNSYNMKDEDINFILDKKTLITVKNDVKKIRKLFEAEPESFLTLLN